MGFFNLLQRYVAMITEAVLLLAGLYLILRGSDWITDAAASLARHLNTTHIAVGLVLVSLLLSLPELLVAVSAMTKGHTGTSIGVSIGSIIVNLGLIIGISAMIKPLKIVRHLITRDAVFMFVTSIVVALIVVERLQITRMDGLIFLLLFIPYLVNVYEQEKTLAEKERKKESKMIRKTLQLIGKIGYPEIVIKDSWLIFLIGGTMLLIGTELFTNALISLSGLLAVPDILIGLTIGAVGTSIPNMAAALQAVRKGYDELAVSETIGSNIVTLLITLGIVAIIQPPLVIDPVTALVTTPALVLVSGVFFFFALSGRISRLAGAVLFLLYIVTMVAEFALRV